IGVDVSKETLDVVFQSTGEHLQIKNDITGFKGLLKNMKQFNMNPQESLIVCEFTGHYSYPFEEFLHQHGIALAKIPALEIKLSTGMVRGKSDKTDAGQIAEYGAAKHEK